MYMDVFPQNKYTHVVIKLMVPSENAHVKMHRLPQDFEKGDVYQNNCGFCKIFPKRRLFLTCAEKSEFYF
jgi:hypothetical protein